MEFLLSVINQLTPTIWVILAFCLIGVETVFPLAIFLWLGIAGFLVAGFAYVLAIEPIQQIVLYSILCPIVTYIGRYLVPIQVRNRHEANINRRLDRLLGEEFVLSVELRDGSAGQTKLGDSVWLVRSTEHVKAGTLVRVIAVEGNVLLVEAIP